MRRPVLLALDKRFPRREQYANVRPGPPIPGVRAQGDNGDSGCVERRPWTKCSARQPRSPEWGELAQHLLSDGADAAESAPQGPRVDVQTRKRARPKKPGRMIGLYFCGDQVATGRRLTASKS